VVSGPTEVTTVVGRASVELERIRGSRFLGDAAPVSDETAALAVVAEVRGREPDATHHAWAYRLASGRERSSDDGEPGGTAGPPILQRIGGAGLHDVVVVVTRYYGGTNLGKGGLVRAYGAAAAAAIDELPTRTRPVLATFDVRHGYELSGAVDGVLAAFDARTIDAAYAGAVTRRVGVPVADAERFAAALAEATSGTVRAERAD
jgi:uncharacterized YigZ family protein